MKKIGILLLVVVVMVGNFAFADDGRVVLGENVERTSIQEKLFEIEDDMFCLHAVRDMDYHADEKAIYVSTPHCMDQDFVGGMEGRKEQYVYDMKGNEITSPLYPVASDAIMRYSIEFDRGKVYSMEFNSEVDAGSSASQVYQLNENELANHALGSLGVYSWDGQFSVSGNVIAYHTNMRASNKQEDEKIRQLEESVPNFYLGTLEPYTTSSGSVQKVYSETGSVRAFDLSPDGTKLIYGTKECEEDTVDPKFMIRIVDTEDASLIREFILENAPADPMERGSKVEALYATDDYLVVLTRYKSVGRSMIQRYTYEGELIDGVEANFQVGAITEGPNRSTLYFERRRDGMEDSCEGHYEIVQIHWDPYGAESESTGRPKAVIAEKTKGGKTIATFKDEGFGLLRSEDPETGIVNYRAPLKSDKDDIRLRIPFKDIQVKLAAGANDLLIDYHGQEIAIPMSAFDCADILMGMPCQDDATIEIHIEADESGQVTVTVELYVIEQVNAMTRIVHRKSIQY